MTEKKAPRLLRAYCFTDGVIHFGDEEPAGACTIATGPEAELRAEIEVTARHGHTEGVLLVPGVPEADNQNVAMDALIAYTIWLHERCVKHSTGIVPGSHQ